MILRIRTRMFSIKHNADKSANLEIAADMEEFYGMLDLISTRTLTDYLYLRLREARKAAMPEWKYDLIENGGKGGEHGTL